PRGTRCASRRRHRGYPVETKIGRPLLDRLSHSAQGGPFSTRLDTMTNTPQIKNPLPGPKAKAIIDRDKSVVSPSYTRGYPLVIERGCGSMVEDVDGNVFLDCAAGIAVNSTGHSHPAVVKAITDQAQKFLHMSGTDFYYEPQVRLAEELAAITPIQGGVRSFFGNSGTEAIEACLKLSRYATGRQNIIAFLGGFHGRSMGSLSLTASKVIQRRGFGPLMPGVYHAPFPDRYRPPLGATAESCAAVCIDYIEHQLFTHLVSPDEVAAIVVEPVQGEGGYVVAPDEFLQRLRELTRQHGILLVADEVQTGMGRSGKMFAIEFIGVELVRDRQTKEGATHERDMVVNGAFRRGLLVLGAGKNAIRFSPPLVLTREQADIAIRIFDEALTEVER